jgi:hypothetical protein
MTPFFDRKTSFYKKNLGWDPREGRKKKGHKSLPKKLIWTLNDDSDKENRTPVSLNMVSASGPIKIKKRKTKRRPKRKPKKKSKKKSNKKTKKNSNKKTKKKSKKKSNKKSNKKRG